MKTLAKALLAWKAGTAQMQPEAVGRALCDLLTGVTAAQRLDATTAFFALSPEALACINLADYIDDKGRVAYVPWYAMPADQMTFSQFCELSKARYGKLGGAVAKLAKADWDCRGDTFAQLLNSDRIVTNGTVAIAPKSVLSKDKLFHADYKSMMIDVDWENQECAGVLALAKAYGALYVKVHSNGIEWGTVDITARFGKCTGPFVAVNVANAGLLAAVHCTQIHYSDSGTRNYCRIDKATVLVFACMEDVDGRQTWESPDPEAPPVETEVTLYCPPRTADAMNVNGPLTPDSDALPPENRCEWKARAVYFAEGETDHSSGNGNLLVFETDNDAPLASATWAWYASECGMSFDQIRAEVYGDARHGVPEAEAAPQPQPETVRFDIRYGSDRIATVDVPAVPTPVPQPAPVAVHGTGRANKAPSTTKAVARRERALDWVCQQAERSGRFSGRMPPRWWRKVGVLPTERLGFVFESDGQRVIVTRRIDNVAA